MITEKQTFKHQVSSIYWLKIASLKQHIFTVVVKIDLYI